MMKNVLISITLLLNAIVFSVNAEDIVAVCTGCSSSQIEKAALQATPTYGTVHVVDFKTGNVKSFQVEHEFEPGFEMHFAIPTSTPSAVEAASREISYVVNDVLNSGGHYNEYTNTLTQTVNVPSSVAETSADVRDYLKSQAVSNYLRLKLIADFWSKFDKAWQKVVEKIIFKVEAKFIDGSTAIYALGPIFFSDHPFVLERGSLKDANGDPISSGGAGTSGGGGDVSYGGTTSGGGLGGIYQQCRSYTISSGNLSWSGYICWFTRTP